MHDRLTPRKLVPLFGNTDKEVIEGQPWSIRKIVNTHRHTMGHMWQNHRGDPVTKCRALLVLGPYSYTEVLLSPLGLTTGYGDFEHRVPTVSRCTID